MAKSFHEFSFRTQVGTFVVLAMMTVAVGWQLLIAPEQVDLATRRAQLARIESDVAKASAVARQLPAFERDIASIEAQLASATAVLPDDKDAQNVLRQLHDLASDSSLDITSFAPQAVTSKSMYSEWPIQVGLAGSYHDLGRFFDRLGSIPLLVSISDLHLKTQTQPGARGSVTASCLATTYVFRHDVPAPAGKVAKTP